MIPIIGIVVNTVITASVVMTLAGTAGTGYAMGRKYGRIACQLLDGFENKARVTIDQQIEK